MVVALQANYLEVELDQVSELIPSRLLCTRRTRLSHRGEAVYVGDRVRVEAIDVSHARAVVADVEPRVSFLTRPPVANATTVVVALASVLASVPFEMALLAVALATVMMHRRPSHHW